MRPASGCKLFGAYQALGGIQDGVVLLHSVVGCNFGSMSLHVAQDMRDIRQTCTVISDSDVVFSGEASPGAGRPLRAGALPTVRPVRGQRLCE